MKVIFPSNLRNFGIDFHFNKSDIEIRCYKNAKNAVMSSLPIFLVLMVSEIKFLVTVSLKTDTCLSHIVAAS